MANSPSHADAAADGTTEFAFKATFDVMKARQAKRRSVFAYIMQRPGTAVYLLILVWLGGCACVPRQVLTTPREALTLGRDWCASSTSRRRAVGDVHASRRVAAAALSHARGDF